MSRTRFPANRASRRQAFHRLFVVAGLALALSVILSLAVSAGVQAASATVVYKGPSGSKQIALTFDDNGDSAHSVATLRALQVNKVPASLFLIGSAVASTPNVNTEIIKGMNAGLFEVGDHSWSHQVLTGLSTSALATEIGGGTDAFHATTGARTVPLFRPPYGTTNSRVAAAAGAEGFSYLVLWDVDPKDWAGGSASSIANHVISHAHSGAIVVMHMSAAHTAAAIPLIVKALRAKGYEFAKVSTMLKGDRLFLDVDEGSDQGAAIARMVQQGFMNGYDGNYFGPVDTITRAQVAKVATEVGGIHTDEVENVDAPALRRRACRAQQQGRLRVVSLRLRARGGHGRTGAGQRRRRGAQRLQADRRHQAAAACLHPGPHGAADEGLRQRRPCNPIPAARPPRPLERLRQPGRSPLPGRAP